MPPPMCYIDSDSESQIARHDEETHHSMCTTATLPSNLPVELPSAVGITTSQERGALRNSRIRMQWWGKEQTTCFMKATRDRNQRIGNNSRHSMFLGFCKCSPWRFVRVGCDPVSRRKMTARILSTTFEICDRVYFNLNTNLLQRRS